jgi:hypothetical protein
VAHLVIHLGLSSHPVREAQILCLRCPSDQITLEIAEDGTETVWCRECGEALRPVGHP